MNAKQISDRELAVVKYAVAYSVTSTSKLYRLAYDGTQDQAKTINPAVCTRWWNSKKIQAAYETELAAYQKKIQAVKEKAVADHISKEATRKNGAAAAPDGWIDYSLPENVLRELNRLANAPDISDKERIEAIKLIVAQKSTVDADAARDHDIHRFYTSLKCKNCVLYKEAKNNLK